MSVHYGMSDVESRAVPIRDGWKRSIISLGEDDSVETGTRMLFGPGFVEVLIKHDVWKIEHDDSVTEVFVSPPEPQPPYTPIT
ncbi:hypothetical protein [Prescottella equi]